MKIGSMVAFERGAECQTRQAQSEYRPRQDDRCLAWSPGRGAARPGGEQAADRQSLRRSGSRPRRRVGRANSSTSPAHKKADPVLQRGCPADPEGGAGNTSRKSSDTTCSWFVGTCCYMFGGRQASWAICSPGNTRWNPKVARSFEKIATGIFSREKGLSLAGQPRRRTSSRPWPRQEHDRRQVGDRSGREHGLANMVQLANRGVPSGHHQGRGSQDGEINSTSSAVTGKSISKPSCGPPRPRTTWWRSARPRTRSPSIQDSYTRMASGRSSKPASSRRSRKAM